MRGRLPLAVLALLLAGPAAGQQATPLSAADRTVVDRLVRACGIVGYVRYHEIPHLAEVCRTWAQERPKDADAAKAFKAIQTDARTIMDIHYGAFRQGPADRRKEIGAAALRIREQARQLAIRLRNERMAAKDGPKKE